MPAARPGWRGSRPEFPRRADRTVVHNGDPVGDAEHDLHVVLDEEHGELLLLRDLADERDGGASSRRATCRQSARRAAGSGTRPRAPSRSRASAGRRATARVAAIARERAEAQRGRARPRARSLMSSGWEPRRASASHPSRRRLGERHVRQSEDSSQKRFVCWNERPMPRLTSRHGAVPGDVLALEHHSTGVRLHQAGDQVEERRLAGAVRADDRVDRALVGRGGSRHRRRRDRRSSSSGWRPRARAPVRPLGPGAGASISAQVGKCTSSWTAAGKAAAAGAAAAGRTRAIQPSTPCASSQWIRPPRPPGENERDASTMIAEDGVPERRSPSRSPRRRRRGRRTRRRRDRGSSAPRRAARR